MSWTLAGTTVKNPIHDGGYSRGPQPIGGVFNFLDGSIGGHKLTTRQLYHVVWRVADSDYSDVMTGLALLYLAAGVVVDHLSNTETMMIRERPEDKLLTSTLHEVSATLEETTA